MDTTGLQGSNQIPITPGGDRHDHEFEHGAATNAEFQREAQKCAGSNEIKSLLCSLSLKCLNWQRKANTRLRLRGAVPSRLPSTGQTEMGLETSHTDKYSAREQGLGYLYQPRFALLRLLQLPESTAILIEKDDDLDFIDNAGRKTLGSLKHKAVGERLTDLSTDFWKSVRIWITRYKGDGRRESSLRFFLFTTDQVSETSFLREFLSESSPVSEASTPLSSLAAKVLARTHSDLIQQIAAQLLELSQQEQEDFLSRITIFDGSPRIEDVPKLIKDQHMRSIRRDFRGAVYERLEGWWHDTVLGLLTGRRTVPIYGYEVSDKLTAFAEEYKSDNLPITFRGKMPEVEVDPESDQRLFVIQLRQIGIASGRIRNAILDYYRAFEQRSVWARESLLVSGEIEEYEDRLADEWARYRDVVFERLDSDSAESLLMEAGRKLYEWADMETGNIAALRIRERVTEPYVVRGGLHILANAAPIPRVYWHPLFLARLNDLLAVVQ